MVVVGSGPSGAVVAYELARAGHDVVLVEEGPPFTPEEFDLDGARSMARTMREGGLRTTFGTIMPTMQAIALGGGSLVNSAICPRPPEFVFEGWRSEFELEHTGRESLDPHYDAVADFLGIGPTPENVLGKRKSAVPPGLRRPRLLERVDAAQRRRLSRQRRVLHGLSQPREAEHGHQLRARGDPARRARADQPPGPARPRGRSPGDRHLGPGGRALHGSTLAPLPGRRACGSARRGLHGHAGAAPEERQSRQRLRTGRSQSPVPSRGRGGGDLSRADPAAVRRDPGLPVAPVPARGLQARDAVGAAGGDRGSHAGPRLRAPGALRRDVPDGGLGRDLQHPPLARHGEGPPRREPRAETLLEPRLR